MRLYGFAISFSGWRFFMGWLSLQKANLTATVLSEGGVFDGGHIASSQSRAAGLTRLRCEAGEPEEGGPPVAQEDMADVTIFCEESRGLACSRQNSWKMRM